MHTWNMTWIKKVLILLSDECRRGRATGPIGEIPRIVAGGGDSGCEGSSGGNPHPVWGSVSRPTTGLGSPCLQHDASRATPLRPRPDRAPTHTTPVAHYRDIMHPRGSQAVVELRHLLMDFLCCIFPSDIDLEAGVWSISPRRMFEERTRGLTLDWMPCRRRP
jgi:hypothetical protein